MNTNSPNSLKSKLLPNIPQNLHSLVPRSFESIGSIGIIEIPKELKEFEIIIGTTLLKSNPQLQTIVKKASFHEGEFRTQQFTCIVGVNNTITQYRENGVLIELDINEVYFSTKLSTEREIITKRVKENSNELVLFSGAGPYSFVISKQQPNISRITSIELNPQGHLYALKNIEHNKSNLKKSLIFKNIQRICKEYSIPLYEKKILKSLNELIYNFSNCDVNSYAPLLSLSTSPFPSSNSLSISSISYKEIFELSKSNNYGNTATYYVDLNELKEEEKIKYLFLLICNPKYIIFNIKVGSSIYSIQTSLEKNYFLQLLTTSKSVDEIIKYNSIYMPLPKTAIEFLSHALTLCSKGGIIYLYCFLKEEELENYSNDTIKKIYAIGEEENTNLKILQIRKVGQSAPRMYRSCIEIQKLD
ncbi:MAG: hypothetical protein ACMXYB_01360 [Candidatus Woesearchaeota archaeon]